MDEVRGKDDFDAMTVVVEGGRSPNAKTRYILQTKQLFAFCGKRIVRLRNMSWTLPCLLDISVCSCTTAERIDSMCLWVMKELVFNAEVNKQILPFWSFALALLLLQHPSMSN
jgi:hypothetical protein